MKTRESWGGRRGSNPRHPEPQSGALPAELRPPWEKYKPVLAIIGNQRPAGQSAPQPAKVRRRHLRSPPNARPKCRSLLPQFAECSLFYKLSTSQVFSAAAEFAVRACDRVNRSFVDFRDFRSPPLSPYVCHLFAWGGSSHLMMVKSRRVYSESSAKIANFANSSQAPAETWHGRSVNANAANFKEFSATSEFSGFASSVSKKIVGAPSLAGLGSRIALRPS
jgi:hypothetical protein